MEGHDSRYVAQLVTVNLWSRKGPGYGTLRPHQGHHPWLGTKFKHKRGGGGEGAFHIQTTTSYIHTTTSYIHMEIIGGKVLNELFKTVSCMSTRAKGRARVGVF